MDFTIYAYNRCVTVEIENSCPFFSLKKYDIYIDGVKKGETDKNVFMIYGLQPDRDYEISLDGMSHIVHTKKEKILLDVRKFGASGDGEKDDTEAITAAIASCPKDGTVYIPDGEYKISPIFLKSNMTLLLSDSAVLKGQADRKNYPVMPGMICNSDEGETAFSSWEGNPLSCFASLINLYDAENTDVIGSGTIDGNADNSDWWEKPKVKEIAWRGNLISLVRCRNIRFAGLTLKNSPSWTIHPYYSDDLDFSCLKVINPPDSPNTDGFDPESCKNVTLRGSEISVGDDCIAIKSGKYYMARYHLKRAENINITNCYLKKGHGAVTLGSEISGGVSRVNVRNCIFEGTDRGIRIKTRRGRGKDSVIDNLSCENIQMMNVPMPLTINMYYFCDPDGHTDYVQTKEMPVDEFTPSIGSIKLKKIRCSGVNASLITSVGLVEKKVGSIELDDVKAVFRKKEDRKAVAAIMMDGMKPIEGIPLYVENADKLVLKNVYVEGQELKEDVINNVLELKESDYHVEGRS